MTNRDFYHAICAPPLADIAKSRTLEEFLRALWLVVGEFRHARAISPEAFLQFLRRAGEIPAPPFREEWRGNSRLGKGEGFDRWENAILSQIADLHAMEENGQLKLEWKCFGIDAPSGARWYNFSVDAFLECGTVG
ncbi:MAG TPA: hypothetical protein VHM90_03075, partial [Phycisphaerae bacterium]|nr:hypothetical protein [Phycisphaerae bacterium]